MDLMMMYNMRVELIASCIPQEVIDEFAQAFAYGDIVTCSAEEPQRIYTSRIDGTSVGIEPSEFELKCTVMNPSTQLIDIVRTWLTSRGARVGQIDCRIRYG